jgi:hypothetical protein
MTVTLQTPVRRLAGEAYVKNLKPTSGVEVVIALLEKFAPIKNTANQPPCVNIVKARLNWPSLL